MASSSSLHKRIKLDVPDPNTESLLVVCKRKNHYFLHEIEISEHGSVLGDDSERIPEMMEIFANKGDGLGFANSCLCANLGSSLIAVADRGNCQEMLISNVETSRSDTPIFLDTPIFPDTQKGTKVPILIGCDDGLFALTIGPSKSLFQHFNHKTYTWESRTSPPLRCSPHPSFISGYVVIEQCNIILFCIGICKRDGWNWSYYFYSYNILKDEWKRVLIESTPSHHLKEYDLLRGRAEFVDGVIYSYHKRAIVTYRVMVEWDDDIYLEPPVLLHRSTSPGSPEITDFSDAPAFRQAPFGLPHASSRCISYVGEKYMGDKMFCVVETAEELSVELLDETHFQPVYINVFTLKDGVIEILDSTVRLVETNPFEPNAAILHCFFPSSRHIRWNRPTSTSPFPNFEAYIQDKISKFCRKYIWNPSFELERYAQNLFARRKVELENSKDPIVSYFGGHMKWRFEHGSEPDPFLIVDKNIDKGLIKMRKDPDLYEVQGKVFVSVASCSTRGGCALYELEVVNGGVVSGCIITPLSGSMSEWFQRVSKGVHGVTPINTSARLEGNLYVFKSKPVAVRGLLGISTIIGYSTFNVRSNSWSYGEASLVSAKHELTIISDGLKAYALSSPSESPESIPKPAFECFDPVHRKWKALQDPPFLSSMSDDAPISGYAIVGDFILISFDNVECDFYAYNVARDEWKRVLKDSGDLARGYHPFRGKAEYVGGTVYVYFCRFVFAFCLQMVGDDPYLHPPNQLKGLETVSPPFRWKDGKFTQCMTLIGDNMFCAIESGHSRLNSKYKYATVTTFSISNSAGIQTWNSSVCVLDVTGLGDSDLCYCFSLPSREEVACTSMVE